MNSEGAPAKKRGCLFYGCLSTIILGLLVVALFVAGFFVAKRFVNNLVALYTDTQPELIESVTYAAADREALKQRLEAFTVAVDSGKGGQELVLSAEDLNVLIAESPELKGKIFIMIEEDKLRGKVSVPLKDIGPLKLNGRYLNGTATLKASLTNGVVDLRLDDILVRSNALPARIVNELKKQNLAKEYQNDPKQQQEIQKYESIRLQDGKVHIRSKETAPNPTGGPATP